MAMQYLYHAKAVGFEADIWEPGKHKIDHARCGLPDRNPGSYSAKQDPFEIPNLISHAGCTSSVKAMAEDSDGFFRTEIISTLNGLNIEKGALTADEITMGMVTMYRRHWSLSGKPYAKRVRVAPYGCKIVNLRFHGAPAENMLPAPFLYSKDQCEAYLRADAPDGDMETAIRQAITGTPNRFKYVKNLGRIYVGEWTLLPNEDWHPIHQITMLRMLLGSPQTGNGGGGGGQGDGGTGGGDGG